MEDASEQSIHDKVEILASATGKPIISQEFSNLEAEVELGSGFRNVQTPIGYRAVIGDEERYTIDCAVRFNYEDSRHYLPEVKWSVRFNDGDVLSSHYTVISGDDFSPAAQEKLRSTGLDLISRALAGIDVYDRAHFMDYESFTIEGLKEDDSYFKSIYLGLMTHLRERGEPVPPILSKNAEIQSLMVEGDVEGVDRKLQQIMTSPLGNYEPRFSLHMEREAEKIRERAQEVADRRDPSIPLSEKLDFVRETVIPGASLPTYTILVVENDLERLGYFTDEIGLALESAGTYGSSVLLSEVNLGMVRDACATGQVDLVLFDWSRPSHHEIAAFENLPVGQSGPMAQTLPSDMSPEGIRKWNGELRERSEAMDMRSAWMEQAAIECSNKGVPVPPHYIVRSDYELENIADIVAQYTLEIANGSEETPELLH